MANPLSQYTNLGSIVTPLSGYWLLIQFSQQKRLAVGFDHWDRGSLGSWITGIVDHWDRGSLGSRITGIADHWDRGGSLGSRITGIADHWEGLLCTQNMKHGCTHRSKQLLQKRYVSGFAVFGYSVAVLLNMKTPVLLREVYHVIEWIGLDCSCGTRCKVATHLLSRGGAAPIYEIIGLINALRVRRCLMKVDRVVGELNVDEPENAAQSSKRETKPTAKALAVKMEGLQKDRKAMVNKMKSMIL
ncbi:uncharacterized [Tachysurus ichikawai]